MVADALSRWAYPASQAGGDVSMHGILQHAEEMEEILAEEKREERDCKKVTISIVEGEYCRRISQLNTCQEFKSRNIPGILGQLWRPM